VLGFTVDGWLQLVRQHIPVVFAVSFIPLCDCVHGLILENHIGF